ncbi:MAG: hypothetical protein GY821_05635 [Gammaproteobacteria bacterium]|nr:hypothetical protein [Gammaproteobacteria bacterium]
MALNQKITVNEIKNLDDCLTYILQEMQETKLIKNKQIHDEMIDKLKNNRDEIKEKMQRVYHCKTDINDNSGNNPTVYYALSSLWATTDRPLKSTVAAFSFYEDINNKMDPSQTDNTHGSCKGRSRELLLFGFCRKSEDLIKNNTGITNKIPHSIKQVTAIYFGNTSASTYFQPHKRANQNEIAKNEPEPKGSCIVL